MPQMLHLSPTAAAVIATDANKYPDRRSVTYVEDQKKYRARLGEISAQFAADLAKEYLPGVPQAASDLVFARAWEDGHSYGYQPVENAYEDLATLVLAVHKALAVDPA